MSSEDYYDENGDTDVPGGFGWPTFTCKPGERPKKVPANDSPPPSYSLPIARACRYHRGRGDGSPASNCPECKTENKEVSHPPNNQQRKAMESTTEKPKDSGLDSTRLLAESEDETWERFKHHCKIMGISYGRQIQLLLEDREDREKAMRELRQRIIRAAGG